MPNEKKLEPVSDAQFRSMVWWYNLKGLIWNLQKHVEKILLKEGMVVVDYGCAPGRYTLPVAKLVGPEGKVFAIDIHPMAISTVKKKVASEALTNIEAMLVDSYNTGIEKSSIDLVLPIDIFGHISDRAPLLQEIHRILKPKGILFMDLGHMEMPRVREIVESSNLFTVVEYLGRDTLVAPKNKQ